MLCETCGCKSELIKIAGHQLRPPNCRVRHVQAPESSPQSRAPSVHREVLPTRVGSVDGIRSVGGSSVYVPNSSSISVGTRSAKKTRQSSPQVR